MPDLIVKLYELPRQSEPPAPDPAVTVRRAMAYEKRVVAEWVEAQFGAGWASECEVAFCNRPVSCHIATLRGDLLGFACYDSVARGFFGPVGVSAAARRQGVGRALLLSCLHEMAVLGYAYAIVGGAGSEDFYAKAVGAVPIPGSTPGIYRDRLRGRSG